MNIKKVFLPLLTVAAINIGQIPVAHAEIPSVTVMSRNIYLGADVGRALELIPNLPAAAQYMWDQVKQTDFSKRAKILATEIKQSSPDVIGLQEATIWYFIENRTKRVRSLVINQINHRLPAAGDA